MESIFTIMEKHLMEDERPSEYFNEWIKKDILYRTYPFTRLTDLVKVEQSKRHHPEGSVWNHTMLVLDHAAQKKHLSLHPRAFMWAALLHDIGKAPTTKIRKGRITSYDHDKIGAKMAMDFLKEFSEDEDLIYRVGALVRWHMQILFVVKDLPFVDIDKMALETSIEEIALLSECDRLGRGEMTKEKFDEEMENIDTFLKKCEAYLMKKKKG